MGRSSSLVSDGTSSGALLAVDLEGAGRSGRSQALAEQLRAAIRRGSLPAGTALPSSRALATELGVSRGVVVRAYEQLGAEGFLAARPGGRTVVATGPAVVAVAEVEPERRPTNPGLPAGSSFPRSAWSRAAQRGLAQLTDDDLGYGDPAGLPRLRGELGAYLGRVRGLLAPPARIIVTTGFAQSARLVVEMLLAGGVDRVGVEDPGSPGLRDQLETAGVRCVGVPVDGEGLDVEALAATGVGAAFVTPAHQFPTGVVMSAARRHQLLDWARRTGCLVIEDDYDAELRYDRAPVGALQGLDPEVVIYGGSVSKTLAPGIRLGWLVVPAHLRRQLADAKYAADLARGVMDQATMAELLASGAFDRHRRRSTATYRRRRDRLVAALDGAFPTWTVSGAAAGLHLVAGLDPGDDERGTAAAAQACGLDARPLVDYTFERACPPALVIGYGHQRAEVLEQQVAALAGQIGATSARPQSPTR